MKVRNLCLRQVRKKILFSLIILWVINLSNVKYRDGRKNFKLFKGAEKVFYNINSVVGYDWCVIVEGEMDVLALHEAGIKNAISVPNGATLNSNNLRLS